MNASPVEVPQGGLSPRHTRILKISIVVMSVMLVAGLMALIFGMARQASKISLAAPEAKTGRAYFKTIDGPGEVKAVLSRDDTLIIHLKTPNGDEIYAVNPVTGQEYGRTVVKKP